MNILHTVEYYHPSTGGAQEVVRQISERLVRRGHRVTVATTRLHNRSGNVCNGVRIEEFEVVRNGAHGFCGEVDRYRRFLIGGDWDIIMNYAAQQWTADLAFALLPELRCRKVLAPCGFSGLYNRRYQAYYATMPDVLKQYDALVFHSETYRDRQFAINHGLNHCAIIPNGAAEEEFETAEDTFRAAYKIPQEVPLVLTVGSHTGLKGHGAAIEAFRRARIGSAVLVIIGNSFGGGGCLWRCKARASLVGFRSCGTKKVLLLDPPRPHVVAAYHAADLFLLCSALECSPIVLYEAMAAQTPFITVDCGNADELVKATGGGMLVTSPRNDEGMVIPDAHMVAAAIEHLLRQPERGRQMARDGRRAWRQRFTWEKISLQYESLYRSLLATQPA